MAESAVQPASDFSPEEITAALERAGAIDEKTNDFYPRIKVDGTTFVTENDVFPYNPKTDEPAFIARIVAPPEQHQAYYFNEEDAKLAGREDMAGRYCKSYYNNPHEARKFGTNGASCEACVFKPFGDSKKKCSWRGDLLIQIIPENGVMTGDEETYNLTLSTTGMIQWRGTRANQNGGSVPNTHNSMYELAVLALKLAPEWGVSNEEAITEALGALNAGYVAAEFRVRRITNERNGQTWSVPYIIPVHIERAEQAPAIEG